MGYVPTGPGCPATGYQINVASIWGFRSLCLARGGAWHLVADFHQTSSHLLISIADRIHNLQSHRPRLSIPSLTTRHDTTLHDTTRHNTTTSDQYRKSRIYSAGYGRHEALNQSLGSSAPLDRRHSACSSFPISSVRQNVEAASSLIVQEPKSKLFGLNLFFSNTPYLFDVKKDGQSPRTRDPYLESSYCRRVSENLCRWSRNNLLSTSLLIAWKLTWIPQQCRLSQFPQWFLPYKRPEPATETGVEGVRQYPVRLVVSASLMPPWAIPSLVGLRNVQGIDGLYGEICFKSPRYTAWVRNQIRSHANAYALIAMYELSSSLE